MKGGDILGYWKERNLRKEGFDQEKGEYDPLTNYD